MRARSADSGRRPMLLLLAGLPVLLACPGAEAPARPAAEPAPARSAAAPPRAPAGTIGGWSPDELQLLRSLSLAALPDPPAPVSNRVAQDPRAAALGQRLFFDPGLSADGRVACASCHDPALHFTDGRRTARGLGSGSRNTPTIVGAVYSPFLFWDGRRDSLWAQALAPLEAAAEMGSTRLEVARYVTSQPAYASDYEALFGPAPELLVAAGLPEAASPYGPPAARRAWKALPPEQRRAIDHTFANVGKAIAAYERRLLPGPARFDRYVERLLAGDEAGALDALSVDEIAGLRLFVDPGRSLCLRCHNGPLLSNHAFHDVATSRLGPVPDLGRFVGLESLLLDPFNCLGPYSDAEPSECGELRFLDRRESVRRSGAFKTPGLRDVARTAPYLHDGTLPTLDDVIEHYRRPPDDPGSEIVPLELEDEEARQMVAFLRSLTGGVGSAAPGPGGPLDAP